MPNPGRNPRTLLLVAWCAVVALAVGIYCMGLPGYWVFDDFTNIVNNDALSYPWDLKHIVAMLVTGPGYLHRPLSTFSFFVDDHLFGLSPEAFKLTNVGIHVATGLTLGAVARNLLTLYRTRSAAALTDLQISWLALTATAIWLVHPINLTAVLYVVQRETALSALCTAAAVLAYLKARQRQLSGDGRLAWLLWLLVPSLILLGIACKENAALTPLFLFLIEFTLLGFRMKDGKVSRQLLAFYAVFLLIPACLVITLILSGNNMLVGGYIIRDFTLSERLMTECRILMLYLRWIVIPIPQQLALYHDDILISRSLLSPVTTLPAVISVLGLIGAAVAARRRSPLLSFGILWFFAGHLMESSVLPLELTFEHRNYLPLFGLVLGVVAAIGGSSYARQEKRSLILVATLVVVIFSGATLVRAMEWTSPAEFAQSEARHHPNSPRAQYELGSVMMAVVLDGTTQFAQPAADAMLRSRELDRNSISEDIALAVMYNSMKDADSVARYLKDAADRAGTIVPNVETQTSLQAIITYSRAHEKLPFEEVDPVFTKVLANPRTGYNPCFAAGIWNTYGVYLQENGRVPAGMSALHKALLLCPILTDVRINYARNLIGYHDVADAREQVALIEAANRYGRYTPDLDELKKALAELETHGPAHQP